MRRERRKGDRLLFRLLPWTSSSLQRRRETHRGYNGGLPVYYPEGVLSDWQHARRTSRNIRKSSLSSFPSPLFRTFKADCRISTDLVPSCVLGYVDQFPAVVFLKNGVHLRLISHIHSLATRLSISTIYPRIPFG